MMGLSIVHLVSARPVTTKGVQQSKCSDNVKWKAHEVLHSNEASRGRGNPPYKSHKITSPDSRAPSSPIKETYEPRYEKTGFFAYAKTKMLISFAVTAKLISAFVFTTRIVQPIYFLYTKFQASSHLVWLYSLVCVEPGRKPRRPVFSQRGSYMEGPGSATIKLRSLPKAPRGRGNPSEQKPHNYV